MRAAPAPAEPEPALISHQHRCLFIHVPKTAGKSILAAFGLPEFGRDYDGALDHIEDPYDHKRLRDYQDAGWFEAYFKFGMVRNPWARAVSAFHYLDAGGANANDAAYRDKHLTVCGGDFRRFLDILPDLMTHKHFRPQHFWLTDRTGKIGVDAVLRFEDFSAEYGRLAAQLGLDPAPAHVNASTHEDYRRYYDAGAIDRIAEIYAEDVERFGYAFTEGERNTAVS